MKRLRILVVEDSDDDFELIKIALEKGGFAVEGERVDNARTMKAALDRDNFDIIISDHQMPSFNSREALSLKRKYDVDLPFILVSGKIGETGAVESMKAGASDYVGKDHLALLPAAVERALDERETAIKRRQAEAQLKSQYSMLETIIDSASGPVYSVDTEYRYTSFNKYHAAAMKALYGVDIELGKSLLDCTTVKKDRLEAQRNLDKALNGEHITEEASSGKEDETRSYYLVSHRPVFKDEEVVGVAVYSHDISKRKQAEVEQAKSFEQLRITLEGTVNALSAVGEHRDPYTAGHQERVTNLACAIAEEMNLSPDLCDDIRIAGRLHDIGKIEVPSEILSKPGKLTDIEFSMIKVHSTIGYDILKEAEFPCRVAETVLKHHERLDGSGYPNGLKADDIQIGAKIMAVADVVEAMSSHRPYRAALGIDNALAEIEENKGRLYDPEVVDACVRLFRKKGFKF